jgi:Lar family restriction alleviation protein
MAANELKPCPFCGDKELQVHNFDTIDGKRYEVWCWQCGARGTVTSSEEAAIKRWNRRADDGRE